MRAGLGRSGMSMLGTAPAFQDPSAFSSAGTISPRLMSPTTTSAALLGLNQVEWQASRSPRVSALTRFGRVDNATAMIRNQGLGLGRLELAGPLGLTAEVSFDERGGSPTSRTVPEHRRFRRLPGFRRRVVSRCAAPGRPACGRTSGYAEPFAGSLRLVAIGRHGSTASDPVYLAGPGSEFPTRAARDQAPDGIMSQEVMATAALHGTDIGLQHTGTPHDFDQSRFGLCRHSRPLLESTPHHLAPARSRERWKTVRQGCRQGVLTAATSDEAHECRAYSISSSDVHVIARSLAMT